MKPINVKYGTYAEYSVDFNGKYAKSKQTVVQDFQSTKILLLKDMPLKNFFDKKSQKHCVMDIRY